jgi:DNA-directed RNA polymerase specialized sigma24 family protein
MGGQEVMWMNKSTNGWHPIHLLLDKAVGGDRNSLALAFDMHRPRLQKSLQSRMEWRLQVREGVDDVLQSLYRVVEKRIGTYDAERDGSFFLWLLQLGHQEVNRLYRRHLAKMRDFRKERRFRWGDSKTTSHPGIGAILAASGRTPSVIESEEETAASVRKAVESLPEIYREVPGAHLLRRPERLGGRPAHRDPARCAAKAPRKSPRPTRNETAAAVAEPVAGPLKHSSNPLQWAEPPRTIRALGSINRGVLFPR